METAFAKATLTSPTLVSASADGGAPEWIQLFPAGFIQGRDGRSWVCDPAAVVARTRAYVDSVDIPIDYEHQLERSVKNGQPAPAAGWITGLEARENGVWGKVEWTAKGKAHVEAREYRYVSPTFYHDRNTGAVLAIESVALTNIPCIASLKALAACEVVDVQPFSKEKPMSFVKNMAAVLGMSEAEPTEAAVEAAVRKLAQDSQSMRGSMSTLAKTVQSPDESPENLVKAAASLVAKAERPDPAKYVPVETFNVVNGELAKMKDAQSLTLVEQGKAEGKITPAMESWAKSLAASNPEGFKAYLSTAPDLRPGNAKGSQEAKTTPPGEGKAGELTAQEKAACEASGISEEEYIKSRAALAKKGA